MKKDFQTWHLNKSNLHENKERPFFHEREIWFTSVGVNIGFEQDGNGERFMRPVIVIKKFNNEVCWCLPLTNNLKKGKYYFPFKFSKEKVSTAILSQLRLMDSKRFQYKIGDMKEEDFIEIKRKLTQFFA
ncbi:MAG: type II toxin-antitoxin system PemK/MazF family toxin [Patescibacteria group bacterium]